MGTAAYYREHRAKPEVKAKNKVTSRARRDKQKDYVDSLKSAPCTDCGQTFPPVCMDWDHLRDKDTNLARAIRRGWSLDRVKLEIAKCELVCSNCHRIRTQQRGAVLEE